MNAESSGLITNQIVQSQRIGLTSECLCFPGLDTRIVHMPHYPSVKVKEMELVLYECASSFRKAEMLHRYKVLLHDIKTIIFLWQRHDTRKTYLSLKFKSRMRQEKFFWEVCFTVEPSLPQRCFRGWNRCILNAFKSKVKSYLHLALLFLHRLITKCSKR